MNEKQSHTFIIAEAGVNHNGSLDMALQLVDAAARAGADAVKFQTFITEKEISRFAPKAEYQIESTGSEESQFEMVKKLELDRHAHELIMRHCRQSGIEFLSSPFDLDSLDMLLHEFDLATIKIPSSEITNGPLLLKAAQAGRRIILSTGMSLLGDIETALGVLAFGYTASGEELPLMESFHRAYYSVEGQQALREKVILLHCTTEYPTPYTDIHLKTMDTMAAAFGLPVGYSDHSMGIEVSVAAVARGAQVIEKHLTIDRKLEGPDHQASIMPDELAHMVASIRHVEQALGHGRKIPAASEIKNISIARKSLVAAIPIRAGEAFTEENLTMKRPGTGLSPMDYWKLLGRKAMRDYGEDEVISEYDLGV